MAEGNGRSRIEASNPLGSLAECFHLALLIVGNIELPQIDVGIEGYNGIPHLLIILVFAAGRKEYGIAGTIAAQAVGSPLQFPPLQGFLTPGQRVVVKRAEARVVGRQTGHIDDGVGVVSERSPVGRQFSLAHLHQSSLNQSLVFRNQIVKDIFLRVGKFCS